MLSFFPQPQGRVGYLLSISLVLLLAAFLFSALSVVFVVFVGLSLIFFFTYQAVTGQLRLFKFEIHHWLALVFLGVTLISALLARQSVLALQGIAVIVLYYAAFLFFRWLPLNRRFYRMLVTVTGISVILVCSFALFHYFVIKEHIYVGSTGIVFPFYDNEVLESIFVKAALGGNLLATLIIFMASYLVLKWQKAELWVSILLSAAILIGLVTMILTGTRGAILMLGFAVLVAVIVARQWKLLIGLALLGVVILFLPIKKIQDTLHNPFNSQNMQGRYLQYETGLKMFSDLGYLEKENKFFGIGLLNFSPRFESECSNLAYFEKVPFIHNNYLSILIETGVLGFVSFFGFFGLALWRILRRHGKNLYPHTLGGFMFVAGWLGNSIFDCLLYVVPIGIFIWIYLGLAENPSLEQAADQE